VLDLDVALRALRPLDAAGVDAADAGRVREWGRALARVRGWLDGLDGLLTVRAQALCSAGGAIDGRSFQREHGSRSDRGARAAVERAGLLGEVPELASAVESGRVGVAHADAVVRAVSGVEAEVRERMLGQGSWLAREAGLRTPEQLERLVRREAELLAAPDEPVDRLARQRERSSVRRWVDRDGMHHLRAELDAERGARVFRALDVAVEAVFHRAHPEEVGRAPSAGVANERLAADALVEVVTRPGGSGGSGGQGTELVVLIDEESLRTGLERLDTVSETSSGVPLPVATVRRMLCEAAAIPVVLGGDGCVLDVGAARRLATREQRRALRAMYRTCAVPGCTVGFDRCQIHHLAPWKLHQRTVLAELCPLCSEHHDRVHHGGWVLELDVHRNATWRAPGGEVVARQAFDPVGPCAARRCRHPRPDPIIEHTRRRLADLVPRE
jgi:hypothetical protein